MNNFYVFSSPMWTPLRELLLPRLLQQRNVCCLLSSKWHIAGKEKVKTTDVLGENPLKIANVAVQCRGSSPSQLPRYFIVRKAFGLWQKWMRDLNIFHSKHGVETSLRYVMAWCFSSDKTWPHVQVVRTVRYSFICVKFHRELAQLSFKEYRSLATSKVSRLHEQ
jgi:hypothetical protein